jgi:hypothetical protein
VGLSLVDGIIDKEGSFRHKAVDSFIQQESTHDTFLRVHHVPMTDTSLTSRESGLFDK